MGFDVNTLLYVDSRACKEISSTTIRAQDMAGTLVEYLTTDTQMKLYRGTVLTIMEKCGEELKIDLQVQKSILCTYMQLYIMSKGIIMIVPKRYGTHYVSAHYVIFFHDCKGFEGLGTRLGFIIYKG